MMEGGERRDRKWPTFDGGCREGEENKSEKRAEMFFCCLLIDYHRLSLNTIERMCASCSFSVLQMKYCEVLCIMGESVQGSIVV